MKKTFFLFLLCGLLVVCPAVLVAQAAEEDPVAVGISSTMEIEVELSDEEERTTTLEVTVSEGNPATLQYGSIEGQSWLLVIGDSLSDSERRLNLVGSVPLFAIHKEDAATLMSGQPLEKAMELYAKRSRLKDSEDAYLYVWLIGTRAARAIAKDKTIPWSDIETAAPLLVNIKNFDHKHNQKDTGKVTLGKGSQVANGSLPDVLEENTFTVKGNGQFFVLLTDADESIDFEIINIDDFRRPERPAIPNTDFHPPVDDGRIDYVVPNPYQPF
jgi:hypothetical protein